MNAFKQSKFKNTLKWIYGWMASIFCTIEKEIFFESWGGKYYADSPRAISEKMHELYPDYKLVWALSEKSRKSDLIPDYIKVVSNNRKKYEYHRAMARAFCVVKNVDFGADVHKRKNQFFIQTWHGDRVLKNVLYDTGESTIVVKDGELTDLCVAASNLGIDVYRTAFHYYGEVLCVGMPRNDKLVQDDEDERNRIKSRLDIPKDKKILLFAPTFRDVSLKEKQPIQVNLSAVLQILMQRGEEWVCLIRTHPAAKGFVADNLDGLFTDVTEYQDMADLLLIADMLITDYSSSAGDLFLRYKPIILAMFDREEYNRNCRQFRFPVDKAGFLIANNQAELEHIIKTNTEEDYRENCSKLMAYFNVMETGHSSEEICRRIDAYCHRTFGK